MSFLKKHWRFTVPAVVVLRVLLLGAVALYSTGDPPEPKRVYAMPERSSPDNSPLLNTGEISDFEPSPSAYTTESPANEFVNDADSLQSCCPEEDSLLEHASADNAIDDHHVYSPSPEAREDARKHREWSHAYLAHMGKEEVLRSELSRIVDEGEKIGKFSHNGQIINVFNVAFDETGSPITTNLSRSELNKYLEQIASQLEENRRKTVVAQKKLLQWQRNQPIEPTYTSKEYTTSHE